MIRLLVAVDYDKKKWLLSILPVFSDILKFSYNDNWSGFSQRVFDHSLFELFSILYSFDSLRNLLPCFVQKRAYSFGYFLNSCSDRSTEKQIVQDWRMRSLWFIRYWLLVKVLISANKLIFTVKAKLPVLQTFREGGCVQSCKLSSSGGTGASSCKWLRYM